MARHGLTLDEDGWLELTLPEDGWSQSQDLEAGQCLTVVALSDAGSVVFVHLDDRRGEESDGASWLETCASDERTVDMRLTGPADTVVAFAAFIGSVASGDVFARSYFGSERVEAAPAAPSSGVESSTSSTEPPLLDASEGHPGATHCDDEEAREHYRRGVRQAREERWDEAADALARAYACHADGTILFNLASVTARQGRLPEAREMYLQLLRDHPNIPQSLRAEVESALDSLRRPGTLVVRMRRGDELFINDVSVEPPRRGRTIRRMRVRVLPGTHTVLLVDPSGTRHSARVRTEAAAEVEIDPRREVP